MKVFRLCRKQYANQFNGKGAAKSNNRWNSKGTEVIYTAESRALAMAEVAVHLTIATMPSDFMMLTIEIPDNFQIQTIKQNELPFNWNAYPPQASSQRFGDEFILQQNYCVLKVPSAVVSGDFNYLINPKHKDFNQIAITASEDFRIDNRLLVKG